VQLQPYTDADFCLTESLDGDPDVMRELGGPIAPERLREIHRRRLDDPWWLKIVTERGAVGTIGVWPAEHDGHALHETGWMVLPAHQGHGIASAALAMLIERVTAEPRFERIHAFPPVTNAPSNALCRKFGFELLAQADFVYAGRKLHCNHWGLDTRG
jgi:RimJ/RimL family protein N-acetyltransferase